MDLKLAGNLLYVVGESRDELGGSHYALVNNLGGGVAPKVDVARGKVTFAALHRAIADGLVAACHDLSEGGLAAAAAEMAFAGGLGAELQLANVPTAAPMESAALLFSESNTRFMCEVAAEDAASFEAQLNGIPLGRVGVVRDDQRFVIAYDDQAAPLVDVSIVELKEAWQRTLRW
jgi:phosphoribosylformylglycinamidine synthase